MMTVFQQPGDSPYWGLDQAGGMSHALETLAASSSLLVW